MLPVGNRAAGRRELAQSQGLACPAFPKFQGGWEGEGGGRLLAGVQGFCSWFFEVAARASASFESIGFKALPACDPTFCFKFL